MPGRVRTIRITGLVRELLIHTVRSCPLDTDESVDRALLTVLVDQLHRLPEEALWLPTPTQPRTAKAAAELINRDLAMPLSVVARTVGTSRRTFERAVLTATGPTLGGWRCRSRILASLAYLAADVSITDTALAVGYSTPSSFVAAFRNELGQPPGRYLHHE